MKILFVVNNFYAPGNGLSASARRTVAALKEAGMDVRVLSGHNHEAQTPQPDYVLTDYRVPVFDRLIRSHGYKFAKRMNPIIEEAVKWADVVHLEEPFPLQNRTAQFAKKYGKAITATYHLHPENLFCSIHLGGWKLLNNSCLRLWRDAVYNYCSDIQCPTKGVLDRCEAFHFKARLHQISNGLMPDTFLSDEQPSPSDDRPVHIACIGRLAVEKDQPTLLKAMRYSKHTDKIKLFFAGRGPEHDHLVALADKMYKEGVLKYPAEFKFETREELRHLAAASDIYVHCARVEVEGLSALEALQQGVVPVVAEGPLTATTQFVLDDRSLFKVGDPKDLAAKLDYWIEHPKERREMALKYVESTEKYSMEKSVEALIKMYETAINTK